MTLAYVAEESAPHTRKIVDVTVVQPFEPFTLSQCMLAKPANVHSAAIVPPKFVLKLVDPRFAERIDGMGGLMSAAKVSEWTPEVDAEMLRFLRIMTGE